MDVPELLRAMAQRIAQVPGVEASHYPKPQRITVSPCVVMIEGGGQGGPSVYRREMRRQEVMPRITARVLVKTTRDTPREESRIDTLIQPILDAFDPVACGGSVNDLLVGLSGHVDHIWLEATVTRGETEYAGDFCYAADIVFDPKFRRTPGPGLAPTILHP